MEEEKIEPKVESAGQKRLPPRPMPPRPPMMRKQIVVEGEDAVQQPPKAIETQQPVQAQEVEKIVETRQSQQPSEQEKPKTKKIADDKKNEKRASQRAGKGFDKKKFWIIFSCVLAGIGVVVGLVFLIISMLPAKPLDTPNNLMISQSNEIVYVTCGEVEGATKYIFEIDGKKYDSKTPSLDLSNFSEPKKYSIKVYAYGKKVGSLSKASKTITYDLRKVLQAPIIRFYESGSSVICWAKIPHATSYELFFNNEIRDVGDVLSYDLNALGGGEYVVEVRAKTTKSGYVSSNFSNTLTHRVLETLQGISGTVLSGGRIEVGKVENATRYEVTINTQKFGVERFDEDKLVIDLSEVGIAKNTVITYFKIEAIGENYFVSNSAELDTTICEA